MNNISYEQIKVDHVEEFSFSVTEKHMEMFLQITKDENPLHCDEKYAKERGFEQKVVYGMLTASFLSTLAGVYLPGKKSLIHAVSIEMVKPVYVGENLVCEAVVVEKNDLFKAIVVKYSIKNNLGEKKLRGKMRIGVLDD